MLLARRATVGTVGRKINQLDGNGSRNFRLFLGLPALKIRAEDEKFAPYLNDANLFFLNDSAEMAHRKAGQSGGVWNIKKHPLRTSCRLQAHAKSSSCAVFRMWLAKRTTRRNREEKQSAKG
jgi:hypothetical protein